MPGLLIAEDNSDFLSLVKEALGRQYPDVTLHTASTVEDARAIIRQEMPDMMLLDIHIGDRNGLPLISAAKRANGETTVIVVTGHDTPEYRNAARKWGADYMLSKRSNSLKQVIGLVGAVGLDMPNNARIVEQSRLAR